MLVNCGRFAGLSSGLTVIRFNDYVSGLEELYRIVMLPVLFESVTLRDKHSLGVSEIWKEYLGLRGRKEQEIEKFT